MKLAATESVMKLTDVVVVFPQTVNLLEVEAEMLIPL